jgi:hypothetical protein
MVVVTTPSFQVERLLRTVESRRKPLGNALYSDFAERRESS